MLTTVERNSIYIKFDFEFHIDVNSYCSHICNRPGVKIITVLCNVIIMCKLFHIEIKHLKFNVFLHSIISQGIAIIIYMYMHIQIKYCPSSLMFQIVISAGRCLKQDTCCDAISGSIQERNHTNVHCVATHQINRVT